MISSRYLLVLFLPPLLLPPRNCGKTLKKEFFTSSSPRSPRKPKWTLFVQNGARHPILSPEGLCVYSSPPRPRPGGEGGEVHLAITWGLAPPSSSEHLEVTPTCRCSVSI